MALKAPKATILYLCRYYVPTSFAAGICADRIVRGLLDGNYRVIVVTSGMKAELEEPSENLILCRIGPKGDLPEERCLEGVRRWSVFRMLPGPLKDAPFARRAYSAADGMIQTYKPHVILATAPMYDLLAVASDLANRYRLPYVIEFCDAWASSMPWPYPHYLSYRCAINWERRCVRQADLLISKSHRQKELLDEAYGADAAKKHIVVFHCFDPPIAATSKCSDGVFRISYTGQFRGIAETGETGIRRILRAGGRFAKRAFLGGRCGELHFEWMSPYYVIAALGEVLRTHPLWKDRVKLVFAGKRYPHITGWACREGLSDCVEQRGCVSSEEAQRIARESDLLLLTLYRIKGETNHWCVPSKTADYLAARKPVLGLLPEGEAKEIIREANLGFFAAPDQVPEIAQRLETILDLYFSGQLRCFPNEPYIQQFQFRHQMSILNEAMDNLCQRKGLSSISQEAH